MAGKKALIAAQRTVPAALVGGLPALVAAGGKPAATAWKDFFKGRLGRNENTRMAYERAVRQFLSWCDKRSLDLQGIRPEDVDEYFADHPGGASTKKQHLSALRRYFNLLELAASHSSTEHTMKALVHMVTRTFTAGNLLLVLFCSGCWTAHESEVVVYTALDREFSEPILQEFEQQTQIHVLAKYDVESTKTVGLVTAIMRESSRPRCDLFWNNEILHTLRLQRAGILDAYLLPAAEHFPDNYRSPEGEWFGFAARARVLIVNREQVTEQEQPTSIHALIEEKWKGRVGIAKPLFGTTATHAAVLFSHWGAEPAKEFFAKVRDNAAVLSGNKQVALSVGRGQLAFGLTDTDDAIIEIEKGMPVQIVYPDQEEGGLGTLFIPNTLCLIRHSPNGQNARRLMDFLLTPEVETRLANGASAQFPLHDSVEQRPRVYQDSVRWMDVDFKAAAEAWEPAAEFLRQTFAAAE
ncbi:MAG: extracellular solute-binding protein [Pirellulales bacterium]